MLSFVLPLLDSFLNSGIFPFLFIPVFCLAFIATVPCIFRLIFRG